MNLNNFVINRVRRGTMFSPSTGEALWSITQVEGPSLNVTTEADEVVDALGVLIAEFDRAKRAELSGQNSLFDLGLAAAQFGDEKRVASAEATITTPKWEEFKTAADQATVVLGEVPVGTEGAEIPFIYALNGDGSIKAKYSIGAEATAEQFKLDAATKTITLPTGLAPKTKLWIPYEFAATSAVAVHNTAENFPVAGKFVMEVLGADVCDTSKKYYAYVVFPNAKLSGDIDLNLTSDGKHPFTIEAMQAYCDDEKRLFSIMIPDSVA